MEFENVKEALKLLLLMNDTKLNPEENFEVEVADEEKILKRKGTVTDLQEFNYEALVNLADILGMSELYLGEKN